MYSVSPTLLRAYIDGTRPLNLQPLKQLLSTNILWLSNVSDVNCQPRILCVCVMSSDRAIAENEQLRSRLASIHQESSELLKLQNLQRNSRERVQRIHDQSAGFDSAANGESAALQIQFNPVQLVLENAQLRHQISLLTGELHKSREEVTRLTRQVDSLNGKVDSLTVVVDRLNRDAQENAVSDKIADVFNFFCSCALNKARKQSAEYKQLFPTAADVVNALARNVTDDDEDDPQLLQQRVQKRAKAEELITQLHMDVDTVRMLNGMRKSRNGLRHFIDNTRHKDEKYMQERMDEFQREVADWAVVNEQPQLASDIIDWSNKALQFAK